MLRQNMRQFFFCKLGKNYNHHLTVMETCTDPICPLVCTEEEETTHHFCSSKRPAIKLTRYSFFGNYSIWRFLLC